MPKCFDNCTNQDQDLGAHICPDCNSPNVHILCCLDAGIQDNGKNHPYNYICVPCFNKSVQKPEAPSPKRTRTPSRKAADSDTDSAEKGTETTKSRRRKSSAGASQGAKSIATARANTADAAKSVAKSGSDDHVTDLTGSVRTIEKNTVAASSRSSYLFQLANFMVFLYEDDHRAVLTANAIASIEKAIDVSNNAQKKKKKRVSNNAQKKKKKRVSTEEHDIYTESKRLLNAMERSNEESCPIILTDPSKLTYKMITDYMSMKKKKVKVNKHLAAQYHKDVLGGEGTFLVNDGTGDEEIEVYVRMSESTCGSVKSSIAYLYKESGVKMPDDVFSQMSTYMKGSKRVGKNAKQSLALSLDEGKKPMSQAVYQKLAKWLFESEDKEHIFAHLFLVLDW